MQEPARKEKLSATPRQNVLIINMDSAASATLAGQILQLNFFLQDCFVGMGMDKTA